MFETETQTMAPILDQLVDAAARYYGLNPDDPTTFLLGRPMATWRTWLSLQHRIEELTRDRC